MEPLACLNGEILPVSKACLPVYDAGVVLGATVSDLVRTFHRQPFRLAQHVDRLLHSLQLARMEIDLSRDGLIKIANDLVVRNGQLLAEGDELGLVVFVTPGEVSTFARMLDRPPRKTPTLCVHTFPLCFRLYVKALESGIRLVIPSVRQVPRECWDPRIKCRSRMHYFLAEKEVHAIDVDAVPLLLDSDNHVTETPTANFLMVESGVIVTTPRNATLPGISQVVTLELASRLGIPVVDRSIRLDALARADEAFLTSTPYCLAPVSHINGTPVGARCPGPIYQRLLEAWNAEVGLDIKAQISDGAHR